MRTPFSRLCLNIAFGGMLLLGGASFAHAQNSNEQNQNVPPTLLDIQNKERSPDFAGSGNKGLPFDIRKEAIREAALSFGARAGLSRRIFQIRQELEFRARYLDKVYDFGRLLIPAPSGLLIEPPIISTGDNAMIIEASGQQAAVSDRIYNIIDNARIVSAPRTWRFYLYRDWGDIEPPPDILLPENDEERKIWKELVTEGWEYGIQQANDIFESDLARLIADFEGMVRYRLLLSQGMISAPYALQVDRGITGGPNEMRIGDRAIEITGVPQLITGSEQWQPASR
ncbi:MAG: type IV secretion system protein DotC [Micavibrio sp.]|nr:type IV secretion system protein DotC [Micavibrio sp.]